MLDVLTHMANGGRIVHRYTKAGNHWQADGKACYTKCTGAVKALIAHGRAEEDTTRNLLRLTTAGRNFWKAKQ